MRRVIAQWGPDCAPLVHRVVSHADFAAEWMPELRYLVRVETPGQREEVERARRGGLHNLNWVASAALEDGDVVVPRSGRAEPSAERHDFSNEAQYPSERGQLNILVRESDSHHALFITNRCNSRCLMCSQPPTTEDDSWLIAEAIDAIRHMRLSPRALGLTGGEPLLLKEGLRRILDAIAQHHPATVVEVLTNGRLFADPQLASTLLSAPSPRVRWLVPLYGHADFLHDFVVQARGAFDETIAGLLNLQAYRQEVQLRTVLIEPVLQVLPELAAFVGRNLPFVREVALMGCEPIGFALANRDQCEVSLDEWHRVLELTGRVLGRHDIPFLFMNTPRCAIPASLWPAAHQSISDWKNVYAPECGDCAARGDCAGLFAWHDRGWKPAPLKALHHEAATP